MKQRKASIDIGSNSILLLVVEFKDCEFDKCEFEVLENHSNITGLGRDLDINKLFIEDAKRDSLEILQIYAQLCKKHGIDPKDVIVTATEASRVAKNAGTFFEEVKRLTELKVQIITPEAEAHFSTVGILIDKNISEREICIMDIGGASTEIIRVECETKKIVHSFSMPVGAVRMNNWLILGKMDEYLQKIFTDFSVSLNSVHCDTLYCVAGTMTSVGNMYLKNKTFIEAEVNGLSFSANDLENLFTEFKDLTSSELLSFFPFLGKRSQTIVSGMTLASAIVKRLGVKKIYISTYGLRYGTVMVDAVAKEFLITPTQS